MLTLDSVWKASLTPSMVWSSPGETNQLVSLVVEREKPSSGGITYCSGRKRKRADTKKRRENEREALFEKQSHAISLLVSAACRSIVKE